MIVKEMLNARTLMVLVMPVIALLSTVIVQDGFEVNRQLEATLTDLCTAEVDSRNMTECDQQYGLETESDTLEVLNVDVIVASNLLLIENCCFRRIVESSQFVPAIFIKMPIVLGSFTLMLSLPSAVLWLFVLGKNIKKNSNNDSCLQSSWFCIVPTILLLIILIGLGYHAVIKDQQTKLNALNNALADLGESNSFGDVTRTQTLVRTIMGLALVALVTLIIEAVYQCIRRKTPNVMFTGGSELQQLTDSIDIDLTEPAVVDFKFEPADFKTTMRRTNQALLSTSDQTNDTPELFTDSISNVNELIEPTVEQCHFEPDDPSATIRRTNQTLLRGEKEATPNEAYVEPYESQGSPIEQSPPDSVASSSFESLYDEPEPLPGLNK